MGLVLVTGTVSMARHDKQVSASGESVTTVTTTEFRIGNRPARIKGGINLAPGDEVRAVGKDTAELEVIALQNVTTAVQYSAPCPSVLVIAGMILLPFIGAVIGMNGEMLGGWFFLFGLVTLPAGLMMVFLRRRVRAAVRMLHATARSS